MRSCNTNCHRGIASSRRCRRPAHLSTSGGAAAFGQLKSLVGHWETEKTNRQNAEFDLELTREGRSYRRDSGLSRTASQSK